MGISSMQFKQAESFAKGTLSYVVQMWKLFKFYLWASLHCFSELWHLSEQLCLDEIL